MYIQQKLSNIIPKSPELWEWGGKRDRPPTTAQARGNLTSATESCSDTLEKGAANRQLAS